eukprot:1774593-Rhodomonas_salina.1
MGPTLEIGGLRRGVPSKEKESAVASPPLSKTLGIHCGIKYKTTQPQYSLHQERVVLYLISPGSISMEQAPPRHLHSSRTSIPIR